MKFHYKDPESPFSQSNMKIDALRDAIKSGTDCRILSDAFLSIFNDHKAFLHPEHIVRIVDAAATSPNEKSFKTVGLSLLRQIKPQDETILNLFAETFLKMDKDYQNRYHFYSEKGACYDVCCLQQVRKMKLLIARRLSWTNRRRAALADTTPQ